MERPAMQDIMERPATERHDIMERPATETRYNGKACNATERQDITSIYEVVDVLGQGNFFAMWG